jgi:hypothetical protein
MWKAKKVCTVEIMFNFLHDHRDFRSLVELLECDDWHKRVLSTEAFETIVQFFPDAYFSIGMQTLMTNKGFDLNASVKVSRESSTWYDTMWDTICLMEHPGKRKICLTMLVAHPHFNPNTRDEDGMPLIMQSMTWNLSLDELKVVTSHRLIDLNAVHKRSGGEEAYSVIHFAQTLGIREFACIAADVRCDLAGGEGVSVSPLGIAVSSLVDLNESDGYKQCIILMSTGRPLWKGDSIPNGLRNLVDELAQKSCFCQEWSVTIERKSSTPLPTGKAYVKNLCVLLVQYLIKYCFNPQKVGWELRRALGVSHPGEVVTPQWLFAIVMMIAEEFLEVSFCPRREKFTPLLVKVWSTLTVRCLVYSEKELYRANARSFFYIVTKLPIELQMILCNVAAGSSSEFVKFGAMEDTFCRFLRKW